MYCSKCGSNLADDATFCSQCGTQMSSAAGPLAPAGSAAPVAPVSHVASAGVVAGGGYAVSAVPVSSAQTAYGQPIVSRVMYAGFWLRVLAYFIDTIVLGIFAVPILIGAAMVMGIGGMIANMPHNQDPFANGLPPAFALFIFLCVCLGLGGTWLYFAFLESSEWQGTAGEESAGIDRY